jgi:hypothetical protein
MNNVQKYRIWTLEGEFDWPGYVKYTPERKGDNVTITFDRVCQLDVSKVRRDLCRYIVDAQAERVRKPQNGDVDPGK